MLCPPDNTHYFTDIKMYLDHINLGDSLEFLRLVYCPVPEESLVVYTDTLGVSSVKDVHLHYANFSLADHKLIRGQFLGLSNVTSLSIESSGVKSLDDEAFIGLSGLKNLKMISNEITSLEARIFEPLNSLKLLEVHENRLTGLHSALLRPLPNLKTFEINLKSVDKLPVDLFKNNSQTEQLIFQGCHEGKPGQPLFTPELLQPLANLKDVRFTGMGLESLPAGLFQVSQIINSDKI